MKKLTKIHPKSKEKAKHAGGRPAAYKTSEALQEKIDAYFESCWIDKVTENTDKEGNCTMSTVRYQDRPYTVAGLAEYLGFSSRQSLLNYDARSQFLDIIKRAKLKIEMNVEERLLTGKNAAGPIFWLKNNGGYKDSQEYNHDVSGNFADLMRQHLAGLK